MIDLTLDRLKRPSITGLVPQFGTTVEVTEKNKGGLSTTEVDANMALAYELQREVNVSTSDTTSIVEHDAKVALIGNEAITLTLQGASYGGCELKITNRGSQTATVVYNDSDRIEVEPTDHLRMVWTAREWWVENAKTPQEQGTNIQTYTYVVDSDQALIDWANNDRNKGQDYTSVLIKKGTWTSAIGVNLTNAGTKVVIGEAGSKIIINSANETIAGIYYTTAPKGYEHYITGVTLNKNGEGDEQGQHYGFMNCVNLSHCVSITRGNSGISHGFNKCSNLSLCSGEGYGNEISNLGGFGFSDCTNLNNCMGIGIGKGCSAFVNCLGVSKCKAGGRCTTGVFIRSYASQASRSDYACADTPAGGFNDTTNPSA